MPTLDENNLDESKGIGGEAGKLVPIGPPLASSDIGDVGCQPASSRSTRATC